MPGPEDVSTTEEGKEFDALPNFYYFQACGRPCWLPVLPTPKLIQGVSLTEEYPYERFGNKPGDFVHVVCQIKGESTNNEGGARSDIWDKLLIPTNKLNPEVDLSQFEPAPDSKGYYGYANDIWLGNTGWHNIPCEKS